MTRLLHTDPLLFEAGDHMPREEFLDRWERMPELKNAELIDGVVYMPSPVSLAHGDSDGFLLGVLIFYAWRTPGCRFTPNTTWLMLESAPQPDGVLRILPEYGGRTGVRDKLASGSPELVAEVVVSSRSYDLGPKLALYQRAGVPEYIAALNEEQRIEWRIFERGSYRMMQPDPDGVSRSRIFPGLWLDSVAYWAENTTRLLSVLEEGLASEEHQRFVEQLRPR
ncbi:MAG: Uma2 family endonuclease [Bryobacteraceae bacterium]